MHTLRARTPKRAGGGTAHFGRDQILRALSEIFGPGGPHIMGDHLQRDRSMLSQYAPSRLTLFLRVVLGGSQIYVISRGCMPIKWNSPMPGGSTSMHVSVVAVSRSLQLHFSGPYS